MDFILVVKQQKGGKVWIKVLRRYMEIFIREYQMKRVVKCKRKEKGKWLLKRHFS